MKRLKALLWLGPLLFLIACSTPPSGDGEGAITVETLAEPSETQTGRFELTNTGSQAVTFHIEARDNTRNGQPIAQWFTVDPEEATLPAGDSVVVELTTNSVFSEPGTYRSVIDVIYPGGPTSFEVTSQIPSATGPQVSLSRTSITLPRGQTSEPITISVSGFSGQVTLSARRGNDSLPAGQIEVNIPDTTVPNGGATTMTARPTSDAAAGTYEIIVVGRSGDEVASQALEVTVPGADGSGSSISGTVRTDNYLGDFNVPTPPFDSNQISVGSHQDDRGADYVPGQLLVQYDTAALKTTAQTYTQLAEAVREAYSFRVLRSGDGEMPDLVALAPGQSVEAMIERLESDPRVKYAEPNFYIYTQSVNDLLNDPEVNDLWNMAVSGLPVAWQLANSASSVIVAVVDTGIDLDHEDLRGAFVSGGYDFCASTDCLRRDGNPRPDTIEDVHGTHVTGTVAARGDNAKGVAGVIIGAAKILPIKVYNNGITTADALSQAIRWAAGLSVSGVPANTNPAKIINISLGTTQESNTLQSAVTAAQNAGALIVAAVGNDGADTVRAPARYPGVLGVGSVNSQFRRSCFSNFGDGVDIVAAGGDGFICSAPADEAVLSTFPGNNYGHDAGTSLATPMVSGVAALVWAQNPTFTASQVAQRLIDTAYKATYMDQTEYGAGVLRADNALGSLGPTSSRRTVGVTVSASGGGDSATDTVNLDLLRGISDPFTLDDLEAGTYTLEAVASGIDLSGQTSVTVTSGENAQKDIYIAP